MSKPKKQLTYKLHEQLLNQIIKGWVREFRFHPTRKWRFDFALPSHKFAVEIEGGIMASSRLGHSTGASIKKDMEKYNAATILDWKVIRVMPEQIGEMEEAVGVLLLQGCEDVIP